MTIIEDTIIGDATIGYFKACDPPDPPTADAINELLNRYYLARPPIPEIVRPTNEQIANTLDRTRQILRRRGWVQQAFYKPTKGRCLLGALKYAIYGTDDLDRINGGMTREQARLHRACLNVLATACDPNPRYDYPGCASMVAANVIYTWNDKPGRTKREVCRMLKATVKSLR